MQTAKTIMLLVMVTMVCGGCRHLSRFSQTEQHMGAPVTITLYAASSERAERAFRAAFDRVAELNGKLSDYDADSELRQLTRAEAVGRPQKISADLTAVLAEARRIGEETDGAFAVSAGPMILLWRLARARRALPPAEKLAVAKARSGLGNWRLEADAKHVVVLERAMRFDLGGIAKGYAADEALRAMARQGVRRALVDAGGDLAIGAPPPCKRGWRIRINSEGDDRVLTLRHCGVATSGDTARYLEIDGVRYSHLVDPRTGMGMTNRALVTVVAPSGTLADAAASTVTVLGPQAGIDWAISRKAAVRYETIGGDPRVWHSANWPAETRLEALAP